ncbi:UNVERIFIED_CONTAM: hypothetical protein Slati_3475300 [Sesamum latifolium]|uniref:Uncharacterized protein n=1 Tax=Sesamum latifolium TaxID=2727402 RepID=A0AAW2UHI6_9LAMI
MADELPLNCRTPAIAEYDGTTDPMEHLSRFENAALLHRYTDGINVESSSLRSPGWHNNGSTSCLWALSETFKNSVPFFCERRSSVSLLFARRTSNH